MGSPKVDTSAEPSWVRPLKFPSESQTVDQQVGEGVYYLLLDQQINAQTQEAYTHLAKKIVKPSGVQEGSKLEVSFDPSYEKLTLHSIRVWRGTESHERLDLQKIKVIQREPNLDRHLYDGRLSALIMFDDIRVGDIVEYSYSITGRNPIFEGMFANDFFLKWNAPVALHQMRLLWPKERKLFIKNFKTNIKPVVQESEGQLEYVWSQSNVPALVYENDLPTWHNPYPCVQLSEFQTWQDVSRWALPIYHIPSEISETLKKKAEELSEKHSDIKDRVTHALRFVQQEVRYLGIEVGPHSHKPREPSVVLEQRFGDCKDKSLLFVALLRQMGIEAYPALVSTSNKHTIDEWHPSPDAFNHVIAQVIVNGKPYWLDSTSLGQGGTLEKISPPDLKRALVIKENSSQLVNLPETPLSRTTIRATFDLSQATEPVTFSIETLFEGLEADAVRAWMSETSRAEIEKQYINYYAENYASIRQKSPFTIQDDLAQNQLTLREEYLIDSIWVPSEDQKTLSCNFEPQEIISLIRYPDTKLRSMPLRIRHPKHVVHQTEILCKENWNFENENLVVQDKAVRFEKRVKYEGAKLTLNYEYQTLSDFVPPEEVSAHLKKLEEISDLMSYGIVKNANDSISEDKSFWQRLNWKFVFYVFVLSIALILVARKIYVLRPPPFDSPLANSHNSHLSGIGGWLILVAIGLFLRPFILIADLTSFETAIWKNEWEALTVPGHVSYHAFWQPTLLIEMAMLLMLLTITVLAWISFIKKQRLFPYLGIALFVGDFLYCGFDYLAVNILPDIDAELIAECRKSFIRSVPALIIWGLYFVTSERVKATFRM